MDHSRRFFLRGQFSAPTSARAPRPPWAIDADAEFLKTCTRCMACLAVCPTSILRVGDGGYPEVSFQANGCDTCGQCVVACAPGALKQTPHTPGWTWRAQIDTYCLALQHVECRVCGEFCDAQAIRFQPKLGGVATPEVQHSLCTGCGHCVSKCPTGAIQMKTPALP